MDEKTMTDTTLTEWIALAREQDERAQNEIYQRFKDMALNYAFSLLGDHDLAEDVRQEAFLQAYCDLIQLRDPQAFPAWFKQIVRNKALLVHRGRRKILVPLENAPELEARTEHPTKRLERQRRMEQLNLAIEKLPEQEREILKMFYLEDLSMKEIERRTGTPVKKINSLLHSARMRLRDKMMRRIKDAVWSRNLAGDTAPIQSAGREALEAFEQELSEISLSTDIQQERACDLICAKGRLLRFMGEYTAALDTFQQGREFPVLSRKPALRARFMIESGLTLMQSNVLVQARRHFDDALALLKQLNDGNVRLLRGIAIGGLGICAWHAGDMDSAREYFEQARDVGEAENASELHAESINNLASLEWRMGRMQEALKEYRACLRIWKKLKNRFGAAATRMNIGAIEENLGRLKPAKRSYKEALDLALELQFKELQTYCLLNLSNLALNEERWDAALERANDALRLAETINIPAAAALAWENNSAARLGAGNFKEAQAALAEAREIAERLDDPTRILSIDLVEVELTLFQSAGVWTAPTGAGKRKSKAKLDGWPKDKLSASLKKDLSQRLHEAEQQSKNLKYEFELPRVMRLLTLVELAAHNKENAGKALEKGVEYCKKQGNRLAEKKLEDIRGFLIERKAEK